MRTGMAVIYDLYIYIYVDAVAFPKKGIEPDWLHRSQPGSRQASWPSKIGHCSCVHTKNYVARSTIDLGN